MNDILPKVLGINWRSTILGIGVIVGAGSRMWLAFRSKNYNFTALAEDGQLIATTLTLVLTGLGFLQTKDANVIGAGAQAVVVDGSGALTNINGDVVGKQAAVPPAPLV